MGIGRRVGGAIGGAFDSVFHHVGSATRLVETVFRSARSAPAVNIYRAPGLAPGLEHNPGIARPPEPGLVKIFCLDYGQELLEERVVSLEELDTLPRPDWVKVRWLRVEGLHPYVVNRFRTLFGFHTLPAEDVLDVPQRARAQGYDEEGHLFVVTQMLVTAGDQEMQAQQISMFVRPELVVSFQERPSPIWEPLYARIRKVGNTRFRRFAGDFLAYAMLDVIMDHCYLVLERYGTQLETLEEQVLMEQGPQLLQRLHWVRRELAVLRRLLWPTRELLTELCREDQSYITPSTRSFLADVRDHCAQLIDMLETFRDLSANLTDLHLSLSSHRMSNVMHVLTLFSVFFIPMTFLAGVFGMNFERLPGAAAPDGFEWFCLACLVIGLGLIWFFRRKRWL